MNIDQLNCFLEVANSSSISKAAERLFISQQALSKSISQLESDLGVQLFLRSREGVRLTQVALKIKPVATKIVKDYQSGIRLIREISKEGVYSVRICFENSISVNYIPFDLLSMVGEEKVHSYVAGSLRRCIDDVKEGRSDIALVSNIEESDGLVSIPLFSFPLQVIVPLDHQFTRRKSIKVTDMRLMSHIWIIEDSPAGDAYIQACIDAGFYPHITASYPNTDMVLEAVVEGKGVTVAAGFDSPFDDKLARVPFEDSSLDLNVSLLARQDYYDQAAIVSYINAVKAVTPLASQ